MMGRVQSKKLKFFDKISLINKIYYIEWFWCKETAEIAFKNYETKKFLNSFFSAKFAQNRKQQVIDFNKF